MSERVGYIHSVLAFKNKLDLGAAVKSLDKLLKFEEERNFLPFFAD